TPGLTVANPTIDIATLAPGQAMDVVFDVAYDGPKGTMVAGELALGVSATNGCGDVVRTIPVRLDVDEVPASSATETFDAMSSAWETGQPFAWQHVRETALDGRWHGDDVEFGYDAQLVSPPISVGAGDLVVSFMHRYVFEYSDLTAFDGGVIEYTADGGATWVDVSTLVATPYSQTINADSMINGQRAFGSQNPAYPDFEPVTLDFGSSLANQTIQLRFRIVTDPGVGARGWDVDDLVITGAKNTPFTTQVADPGVCGVGPGADAGADAPPPGEDAGCCSTSDLSTGELGLVIGVVVILVRRRRIAAVTASWQGPNL
ncbi:MAG: hypothetical protein NT062_34705, partial [Proteobacteria bacterium]|nr:hypothetical protein [Pseudomonadota bacterium]